MISSILQSLPLALSLLVPWTSLWPGLSGLVPSVVRNFFPRFWHSWSSPNRLGQCCVIRKSSYLHKSDNGSEEEKHRKCWNVGETAAKVLRVDTNVLCSGWYPTLCRTHLCHSLSSFSHIHLSLPSGSANPFCTPLVHFPWPPPSHLSNGGIVLMDRPKRRTLLPL